MNDPRRAIPSVESVIQELRITFGSSLPHEILAACSRRAIDEARANAAAAATPLPDTVVDRARDFTSAQQAALLQPVINATGVLLHTNLGRAPLGATTVEAMVANASYCNLEFDIADGTRGSRHDHAGDLLAMACGAEAAIVVNNNAAAVVLVLAALARDREVIVSRGELVEIGGGFRVPEILAETGARLVEVGTTNRTRFADYRAAVNDATAMTLKVHASNYRMIGFTETTPIAELATLDVPVVVDAGSGLLDEQTPWLQTRPTWLADEPGIRQCLESGADIVTFSGDKLLGGPQAGIIVGRRDLIELVKRHPLARALRSDKLTLAGLQAVALAYLDRDVSAIPFWAMATASLDVLEARARRICDGVNGGTIVATEAAAGGGSLPGCTIPSCGVAIAVSDSRAALRRLRIQHRVVALARDAQLVCDLRSVDALDDDRLIIALNTLIDTQ